MQEIHDNCVDIKVTKSFYDKQMLGEDPNPRAVQPSTVVTSEPEDVDVWADSPKDKKSPGKKNQKNNIKVKDVVKITEEDQTDDEILAMPPGQDFGAVKGVPALGPLRKDDKYTGEPQNMFRSISRNSYDKLYNSEALKMPGFQKYTPKRDFTLRNKYAGGVSIPSGKKDTSQLMIKISPCKSSLQA